MGLPWVVWPTGDTAMNVVGYEKCVQCGEELPAKRISAGHDHCESCFASHKRFEKKQAQGLLIAQANSKVDS
jgi:RNA polymerase-binding transcription factor DksA